jgi:hypothetical protein
MCQILGLKGLEPSPLAGHDPKSCASASSATGPAVDEFHQFGPRFIEQMRRDAFPDFSGWIPSLPHS